MPEVLVFIGAVSAPFLAVWLVSVGCKRMWRIIEGLLDIAFGH